MSSFKFASNARDGSVSEITLTKLNKSTGRIQIDYFKRGAKKPTKSESYKLKNISASKDGREVRCHAEVSGPDPLVIFWIDVYLQRVTMTVSGAWWGNGTTVYPVSSSMCIKLQEFIKGSGFKEQV